MDQQPRSAQVWAAIAVCAGREGTAMSLRHAVTACADGLAAEGVGLSVARDGALHEPLLASAPAAEELEELQFTLGQGPCMDAVAGRGPVLVADLAQPGAQRRWPLFASAAADRGVRGMFSFPVAVGAALVGVLDVYRFRAGPLARDELEDGLLFADAALVLALDERDGIEPASDGLADAVVSTRRVQVHQATGMIAAQLGLNIPDALAALRAHAYAHGRRVSDLAADVVARRVRLGPLPPRHGPPGPEPGTPEVSRNWPKPWGSIAREPGADGEETPEAGTQHGGQPGEEE